MLLDRYFIKIIELLPSYLIHSTSSSLFALYFPLQDQQLSDWYDFFVKRNGLKDDQCLIFAHRQSVNSTDRFRPRKLSSITLYFPYMLPYIFIYFALVYIHVNTAPLFQRVTAALTTSNSGNDIKSMFDKLVQQANQNKKR